MWMKEKDIVKEYREAKDKPHQIIILADQNCCERRDIENILGKYGINTRRKK